VRERERDEQSQTQENCFEVRAHLLYVPAFNTVKDFHYNDPARSLGAATPTPPMSSLRMDIAMDSSNLYEKSR